MSRLPHRLVSPMRHIRFLAVQSEGLYHRRIREGKKRRDVGLGAISVLVAGPGRQGKDIPLFPIKALPFNNTPPGPGQNHVDATAGLAMGLGVHAGTQILRRAPHRGQDRTAGVGIGILEEEVIVGGRGGLRKGGEGCRGAAPFVIQ